MRTLIFTDVNSPASARLIDGTVALARVFRDVEVVGIVTSRPERFRRDRVRSGKRFARGLLVAATNRQAPWHSLFAPAVDLARLQRRHGIRVLVPEARDPNDRHFVERLRGDVRAELALSYDCLTIFRQPLLATFAQAVNYHAGALPHYRGVMATSFSVLAGETHSGFTFHRMAERVDAGPILVEGSVPVAGGTGEEVGRRKLAAAVAALPEVLRKIAANDPGRMPQGTGRCFTARDWSALLHVDDPEAVTAEQLARRIRAFGVVHVRIAGSEYPVTRVRAARAGDRLAFSTADAKVLAPDRLEGLPLALHHLVGRLFPD